MSITIYKIVCNDENIKDVYVGSTRDFAERKYHHELSCINTNDTKYHFKLYQCIRNNGGFSNWSVIPIKVFTCETKQERLLEERKYVEELNATLNMKMPIRTKKEQIEYYKNNKNKVKEYVSKNKDKIKQYKRQWNIKNKDKINAYRREYRRKKKLEKNNLTSNINNGRLNETNEN